MKVRVWSIYRLYDSLNIFFTFVFLGERLTSVLSLPLHGGGQAASWQHVVVAGFSSGAVRVFSDTGRLLVQVQGNNIIISPETGL